MTFHISGAYAVNFGLDRTTQKLSYGGWSAGANSYAIYHEGNKPTVADLGYDTTQTDANAGKDLSTFVTSGRRRVYNATDSHALPPTIVSGSNDLLLDSIFIDANYPVF